MIKVNSVLVLSQFILVLFLYESINANYAPAQEKDNRWKVSVRTGDVEDAWTDSDITLILRGENGNITLPLEKSITNIIKFKRGTVDWFYYDEKYIGQIESMEIKLSDGFWDNEWFLENIWVYNVTSNKNTYYFGCNCWITKDYPSIVLQPYQKVKPIPGVKGRITEKAIDYVIDNVLDYGMTVYQEVPVPDRYYDKIVAGVGLSNIKVLYLTYPDVQLTKRPGKLLIQVYIDMLKVQANYKATYLKLPGSGTVDVNATDFYLHFDLVVGRNEDNMPYLSLPYCRGEADFDLKFDGGHDTTLNFFTKRLPSVVNDEAYTDICTTLSKIIYDQVNELIKSQMKAKLSFAGICLDMSLTHKLNVMSNAFEIGIRGEFSSTCDNNNPLKEEFTTEIPVGYEDNSKMLYAYVTEHSINSALSSAYQTGKLTFKLTKELIPEEFQTYVNFAKILIPELLGTDTEPVIFVKPTESPHIHFEDGKAFIKVSIDANVLFIGENESHLISELKLVSNMNCDLKYNNSNLNFLIHDIDSTIDIEYISYEPFGNFLKGAFQPIMQLVKTVSNKLGKKGIPLEIPEFSEIVQLQNSSAEITEDKSGYLRISSNLNLSLENLKLNFDDFVME